MAKGDQIYVMRPFAGLDAVYEHHGIDCGDGTVIHYYKGGGDPVIERTTLETFARGTPIYTKKVPIAYIPDVVVERAESRLGERDYNLLTNNCEHFVNWCKTGQNTSQQLINYGLDPSRLGMLANRRAIEEAAQEGDPVKAVALMQQALGNISVTQITLQNQYSKAQDEVITWDQVARLALQKKREDLAKAALERKVEAKRKAATLQNQLAQLAETELNLKRNSSVINQRLTYSG
ncbi:lecithin retinol acyltransferase family protein [Phormidium tenue FACHB-886]|nr:lecithin retinol acyltransferase family protein [Phormidium tenue FACHB-886]